MGKWVIALITTCAAMASADSWRAAGATNDVRESTGIAVLNDGSVLIASGHPATRGKESRWRIIGSTEVFDPKTETWSLTGDLVNPRQGVRDLTVLQDGTVLLAGEHMTRTGAELFDPKTGAWTETEPMHVGRGVHVTVKLTDGRVLVAGGIDYAMNPGTVLSHAEIYDPAARAWTVTANMHTPRYTHAAVILPDGRVLVAGGSASDAPGAPALASAEIFDPASGAWTETAPMHEARKMPSAAPLPDGRVLVAGGTTANGEQARVLAAAEVFDPRDESWAPAAPMLQGRVQFPLVALRDGRVMAIAGVTRPRGSALNTVEIYDSAANTWSTAPPLQARRWNHRAVLLHNGDILAVGGFNVTGELSSTEIFSPR